MVQPDENEHEQAQPPRREVDPHDLLSTLEVIEAQPLATRAEAYDTLHDTLAHRLEGVPNGAPPHTPGSLTRGPDGAPPHTPGSLTRAPGAATS